MKKLVFFFFQVFFLFSGLFAGHLMGPQSHPYTWTFRMSSGNVTLTLKLTQGEDQSLTGTLSSTNGTTFQVNGTVEQGGVATGTCTLQGGGSYFESYLQGDELVLTLIQPDANGEPDYDKTQQWQFKRSGGGAVTAAGRPVNIYQQQAAGQPSQPQQQYAQQQPQQYAQQPQQQARPVYAGSQPAGGAGEVGDDMWGFKFVPPSGWVTQKNAGSIIVGHNTIAGMIIVFPHTSGSMQEMQSLMMQGIQDNGTSLNATGSMQQVSNNVVEEDYAGVVNGQQIKGKGYGALSPYRGGAFVLALATPDKISPALTEAARQIALNMRFVQPSAGAGPADLMQFFADTWVTTTTNTSSYVTLYADGSWSDRSESSYSGNFTNGGGANTGNWGAAGQQQGNGRWSVRGNKDQGQLIVITADGQQHTYEYRVHIENGQKYYSEYYFNGTLYHRRNKYDD